MSIGLAKTKTELDAQLGDWARDIQRHLQRTATLKSYFDGASDDELITMGYTADEVPIMKSAVADGWQADQVFVGLATQPDPKDSRVFIKECWGIGAF